LLTGKAREPKVMEPEKCEGWAWYELDNFTTTIIWTGSQLPSKLIDREKTTLISKKLLIK